MDQARCVIVGLDLHANGVKGSMQSSLSLMSWLQALHLENNDMVGDIPNVFHEMPRLKVLGLHGNDFNYDLNTPKRLLQKCNTGREFECSGIPVHSCTAFGDPDASSWLDGTAAGGERTRVSQTEYRVAVGQPTKCLLCDSSWLPDAQLFVLWLLSSATRLVLAATYAISAAGLHANPPAWLASMSILLHHVDIASLCLQLSVNWPRTPLVLLSTFSLDFSRLESASFECLFTSIADSPFVGATMLLGEESEVPISSPAYNELKTTGVPFYIYKLLRVASPLMMLLLLMATRAALARRARKLRDDVWDQPVQQLWGHDGKSGDPRGDRPRLLRGKILGPLKTRYRRQDAIFMPLTRPHWHVDAVCIHGTHRA